MKIQDQVCTLEQSQELHKMGINPHSYLFWHLGKVTETWIIINSEESTIELHSDYSAFSVAELGLMLPCESGLIGWECWYSDHIGQWYCTIRDLVKWEGGSTVPPVAFESEADTMAQAMADAVIHCLENKLITAAQVNKQLAA